MKKYLLFITTIALTSAVSAANVEERNIDLQKTSNAVNETQTAITDMISVIALDYEQQRPIRPRPDRRGGLAVVTADQIKNKIKNLPDSAVNIDPNLDPKDLFQMIDT